MSLLGFPTKKINIKKKRVKARSRQYADHVCFVHDTVRDYTLAVARFMRGGA